MKLQVFTFVSSIVGIVAASELRGAAIPRFLQAFEPVCEAGPTGCVTSEMICPLTGDPMKMCTPYLSKDYCGDEHSFPTYISKRRDIVSRSRSLLEAEGWWFHHLDDKLAGYIYASSRCYNPPTISYCSSGGSILDKLDDFSATSTATSGGFVIRATHLHSNSGIYVLPGGFGGQELLRGFSMSLEDVKADLVAVNATKFIVEAFIPGPGGLLPTEFKFHVFMGEIGSINVLVGRGTCDACWAEIDENEDRLDLYGCFAPGGYKRKNETCMHIDFNGGAAFPSKIKGAGRCPTTTCAVHGVDPAVFRQMVIIAKKISLEVGVYVRVDMFVSTDGTIHVQEFSTNHLGGNRHCSAKLLSNGCIDSCYLGRFWQEFSLNKTLGGKLVPTPVELIGYAELNDSEKCALVESLTPTSCPSTIAPSFAPSTAEESNYTTGGSCREFYLGLELETLNGTNVADITASQEAAFEQLVVDSYNFLNTRKNDGICDNYSRRAISFDADFSSPVSTPSPAPFNRRRLGSLLIGGQGVFKCKNCPKNTDLTNDAPRRRRQLKLIVHDELDKVKSANLDAVETWHGIMLQDKRQDERHRLGSATDAVMRIKRDNSISGIPFPASSDLLNESGRRHLGSVAGKVQGDENNDDTGDINLAGVPISLLDDSGVLVGSTLTDSNGDYIFSGIPDGTYTVGQTNIPSHPFDVSDTDGGDLNSISVVLSGGSDSFSNNFLDAPFRSITGQVLEDTNCDGNGDTPIPVVLISLLGMSGTVVGTTATDSTGDFLFEAPPGSYVIFTTFNLSYEVMPTVISVNVASLDSASNLFVYKLSSSCRNITGQVLDTDDFPTVGVTITLRDSSNVVVATTSTGSDGMFSFQVPAGSYTVEQPPDSFLDVSDSDGGNPNSIDVDVIFMNSGNNIFTDCPGNTTEVRAPYDSELQDEINSRLAGCPGLPQIAIIALNDTTF